jgi:hypothetical protein
MAAVLAAEGGTVTPTRNPERGTRNVEKTTPGVFFAIGRRGFPRKSTVAVPEFNG